MKTLIEKIVIKERIRKDILKISELAEDIRVNGLLNPVTVMALDGGEYQLLAGLRRIRAVQSLELAEIDVNVVAPADAEAALRIEISENEQREDFTFSEKMDYARLLEGIEREKAKERMLSGKKGNEPDPVPQGAQGQAGKTRDIVASKIGMGKTTYDRAKYVAENAPPEVIDQIDSGERSIRGAYEELRSQEKADAALPDDKFTGTGGNLPKESEAAHAPSPETTSKPKRDPYTPKRASDVSEEEQLKYLSARDKEEYYRRKEFAALPPEGKIADLERQLFDMRVRANNAESELETLKYEYGIKVDHKDSIIASLKRQVAELSEALESAEKRIAEMEK